MQLSSHWIQFVKLYHSFNFSDTSMELCELHLKILLDFAIQKNEDVKMKFYQLRVMDFLVREVSLEYEVTLVTNQKGTLITSICPTACDVIFNTAEPPKATTAKIAPPAATAAGRYSFLIYI